MTQLSGQLIAESLDYDGGRAVTAYLPEAAPGAVVFAADGAGVPGLAAALEAAGISGVAIVGAHGLADEMSRLEEYSPGFNPERFRAHEQFVVEDVRGWARQHLGLDPPASRSAVFGASAGGELAIALGLRHPDLYGAILAGSPGAGYRPPGDLSGVSPRTYLVAGTQEPFFLDNAARWGTALRDAGAEVVFIERDADHGSALWNSEFPRMIAWAFG